MTSSLSDRLRIHAVNDTGDPAAPIRSDYPEPLWIQAVQLIEDEIAKGILRPGSRLPSERELCLNLRISRVTLRKALSQLVKDGALSASHGRGWFVAARGGAKEWPNKLESFTETAARMGLVPSSRILRAAAAPASLDEAEQLSIAPGTPLFHLERVRLLDDVPIAVDRTRIPASLVPGFGSVDFAHESLYSRLSEAGVQPASADTTIEACEADADVAALIGLEVGKPILVMNQVVRDEAGRPLFASTIEYSGERYRLRTVLTRAGGKPRARRARTPE
jgi:GntR family transcriptional regulator